MEFTKKTLRSGRGSSLIITIPFDVVNAYDVKEGDYIVLDLKKVIKK